MRDREHPHAPAYEQELVATVGSGTERWFTQLRLAVIVVGVASTLVFVVLWRLRPRTAAARRHLDGELRALDFEIAALRAALEAERDPLREILDNLASEAETIADHADRIAEEAYLTTDSGSVLRRLRDYDRDLTELAVEIRCRRKSA